MKISRLLHLLLLCLCSFSLSAQDVHYTLFDFAPTRTNPALTGAFNGTARVGGIYRGQWMAVGNFTEFSTPVFYADAPVIKGFRDQDWVGAGITFLNDEYGAQDLTITGGLLSGSYHFANKKQTQVFTIGLQFGRIQRRIRRNAQVFEEIIDEAFGGGGATQGEFNNTDGDLNTTYNDFNFGVLYRNKIDKSSDIEIGMAGLHLFSPQASLLSSVGTGGGGGGNNNGPDDSKRRITVTGHAIYNRALDNNWSVTPKLFMQSTPGGGLEAQLQGWAGKRLNDDFKLNFGLGYRLGDAANVLFGVDYKDLRAALAYDVTLNGANEINNFQGGFELAAYYIIKIYDKPTLPPTVVCPRF